MRTHPSYRLLYLHFRSTLYVYIFNNTFISLSIFHFLLSFRAGVNKYIFFYSSPNGQRKSSRILEREVDSWFFFSLVLGALVKGSIGYTIHVKSRFTLDLTHMIEVSSKFVCCLARISQPRGDLNPGRGPIF